MRDFFKAYFWPIAAIAAYVLCAVLWHGWGYVAALRGFLEQPEWWAENTFSVIVFTALVSVVVNISARRRQEQERAPFEKWTVRVIDGAAETAVPLNWEEVRRFETSPLEERRFIQSVISAQGEILRTGKLDLVTDCSWVERDPGAREYRIDMAAFRASTNRQQSGRENAESGSEGGRTI